MKRPDQNFSAAAWFYRALAIFVVAACVATFGAWPIVRSYDSSRIEVIEARERGYAEAAVLEMQNAFLELLGDLRVAASLPAMTRFLDQGEPEREDTLAGVFRTIMDTYGRYDQIRLLDMSGWEIVRVNNVNGLATAVPHAKLQNKTDRYYFREALKLGRGEVYVSPLDLNVENGKVELPYKPMIRMATAVFDSAGRQKGILVFNIQGEALLARFREIMQGESLHNAMLLNPDGYWLSNASSKGSEWGFLLGRNDENFGKAYPAEWPAIAANDRGSIKSKQGLFVFSTVVLPKTHPTEKSGPSAAPTASAWSVRTDAYYWKVVLLISQDALQARSLLRLPLSRILFAAVYVLLLLLSALTAYLSLYRRHARDMERFLAREIEDLYEKAPCGYHSLDRNGLIVRMNETELHWLGYTRAEVVGKLKITDLMNANGREAFREHFPRLISSGRVDEVNAELVRKDGTALPVVINASAVQDDSGNFVMSRSSVFDATERRRLETELIRQANTDALTGISNRRHFFELAEHELARSLRSAEPLSLFLLDIDHFKEINDAYGHDAGDAVLKSLSATATSALREIDVFARVGGEEFVALLPDADSIQAQVAATRLRERLAQVGVPLPEGELLHFTVSIGVASLTRDDARHADLGALLKRADAALYKAKNAGRNRVCVDETAAATG